MDEKRTSLRYSLKIILLLSSAIFVCEALVMGIMAGLAVQESWKAALLDSTILLFFLSPVLYFLIYRPMQLNLREKTRNESRLLESRERLETVFQTSPDAIILSRLEDGLIVKVNEGFVKLTGFSREEAVGRTTTGLGLWAKPEGRAKMIDLLKQDGHLNNLEIRARRRDGAVFTGLLSARCITLGREPHLLSVLKDIDRIKQVERKITIANRFLKIANTRSTLDALLKTLIAEVKTITDCSAAAVGLIQDHHRLTFVSQSGFAGKLATCCAPKAPGCRGCLCAAVFSGHPERFEDHSTQKGSLYTDGKDALVTLHGAESMRTDNKTCLADFPSVAVIPIQSGEKLIGFILMADERPGRFGMDMVDLLEFASFQMGVAIERSLAADALLDSHLQLERIVAERTAELEDVNEKLQLEIQEKGRQEALLLENQRRLRDLTSELLRAQNEERKKLATELHDSIGHNMAILKIGLKELQGQNDSTESENILGKVMEKTSEIIQEVRSMSFNLSPPSLYSVGVGAALEELTEQMMEEHGLQIVFMNELKAEKLDEHQRFLIYTAARELLFNIVKHARAQKAVLSLKVLGGRVEVTAEDNGKGFDPGQMNAGGDRPSGFGLFSIRERAISLGGDLTIESRTEGGSRVRMTLPFIPPDPDRGYSHDHKNSTGR